MHFQELHRVLEEREVPKKKPMPLGRMAWRVAGVQDMCIHTCADMCVDVCVRHVNASRSSSLPREPCGAYGHGVAGMC